MIMRHQPPTCQRCQNLRVFLSCAGLLLVGMYLQPEWATQLARHMPGAGAIGGVIFGGFCALLALRLYQSARVPNRCGSARNKADRRNSRL